MLSNIDLLYHLSCLCTTWRNVNPGNLVFSVMLYKVSVLACYFFNTYQPMLIILCRLRS